MMFQWLFEQFKGWHQISRTMEKIRSVPFGHRRKTWMYLWTAIQNQLDRHHEDANCSNLHAGIVQHKLFGAAAQKGKTRRSNGGGKDRGSDPRGKGNGKRKRQMKIERQMMGGYIEGLMYRWMLKYVGYWLFMSVMGRDC